MMHMEKQWQIQEDMHLRRLIPPPMPLQLHMTRKYRRLTEQKEALEDEISELEEQNENYQDELDSL